MLHKQSSNIFGFSDSPQDYGHFQKTASFFNPFENEAESSFSTQNTDATRENSSQSTPQQTSKGDIKTTGSPPTKRVVTVKLYNHNKNLSCANVALPGLLSHKSSPPVEKTTDDKVALIRNCLSQESIRRPLLIPKEFAKPEPTVESHRGFHFKTLSFHQRAPSARSNCQSPSLLQKSDNEIFVEQENNMRSMNQPTTTNNNKFLIRSQTKNKIKVTKFNKIKVITAIPGIDQITPRVIPSSLKKVAPEKKTLKFENKKKISLEINTNNDEGKVRPNNHAFSCHSKAAGAFVFPEPTAVKIKAVSPVVTHLCLDGVLPNTVSMPVTLKRVPSISQKGLDLESLKGALERKTCATPGEDSYRVQSYRHDAMKSPLNIPENRNLTTLVSPPILAGSNIYSFKTPELSTPTTLQGQELKIRLQKKMNPKFKNEEAVLNKLFNSLNEKKE